MIVTNRLAYLNTYYVVDLLATENVNVTVDQNFLSLLTYCGEFLDTILDAGSEICSGKVNGDLTIFFTICKVSSVESSLSKADYFVAPVIFCILIQSF